jgi:hypothetical protein
MSVAARRFTVRRRRGRVVGVAGLARVERRELVAGEDVDVIGTLERPSTGFLIEGMSALENVAEDLFYSDTAAG